MPLSSSFEKPLLEESLMSGILHSQLFFAPANRTKAYFLLFFRHIGETDMVNSSFGFFCILKYQKNPAWKIPRRVCVKSEYYIIPIPGAPPAGIAGSGSLMFATTDSVVSSVDATEFAFCSAVLVTLTGSRIPLATISTYSSL